LVNCGTNKLMGKALSNNKKIYPPLSYLLQD